MSSTSANSTALPKNRRINTIILFGLWLAVFYPVYPELVNTWLKNSNNSHGILVPLISAYLIWQKRAKLKAVSRTTSAWGAVLLVASVCLYILSYVGAVAVVSRAMIVSSLIGIVLFNFGKAFFAVIRFPLFYLLFMVPIPDSIYGMFAFPLQLLATKVSAFIIQSESIPVLREGNMLYFGTGQLEVAEACSGLRSMMSFIMLSFLFAYIMKPGWRNRIIIVASAIPLAIFTNIVRVTGTGILGHLYGARFARGFLHEFSGLALFVLGFVLLMGEFLLFEKVGKNKET
jgi:exosortase